MAAILYAVTRQSVTVELPAATLPANGCHLIIEGKVIGLNCAGIGTVTATPNPTLS